MAQAQVSDTDHDGVPTGIGWRLFQIAGLLTALSWVVSYLFFLDGYTALSTVFGFSNPIAILGGIAYFLSPLISLVLIGIAVWPGLLNVLNRGDGTALAARAVLFVVPAVWMATVFLGASSMIGGMMAAPLSGSSALPIFGGATLHVVFQHWFQGLAAMGLALVPSRFSTLTESDRPAGIQCAVVECR